jgi:hypothetical protein
MGVGLNVGKLRFEVGTSDFLNAFFSTIVMRLEAGRWGDRYPTVMNRLYMGEVSAEDLVTLQAELRDIREQLRHLSPELIVWDFENPAKRPPWGSAINSDIRSLSDYFWTSDGKQLFEVFASAIDKALAEGQRLTVS